MYVGLRPGLNIVDVCKLPPLVKLLKVHQLPKVITLLI
jgi:hypothetical protein